VDLKRNALTLHDGDLDRMVISMTLLKGLTLPDGEVDPTVISMILSNAGFNPRDGGLVPMDICMISQKGLMHHDGVVALMDISMILQKEARWENVRLTPVGGPPHLMGISTTLSNGSTHPVGTPGLMVTSTTSPENNEAILEEMGARLNLSVLSI